MPRAPCSISARPARRSPFGLRSELQREHDERGAGRQFRVEVNQQYRTRWFELLMVHKADHGSLPPDNAKNPPPLGRLSPISVPPDSNGEEKGPRWISNPAKNSRC